MDQIGPAFRHAISQRAGDIGSRAPLTLRKAAHSTLWSYLEIPRLSIRPDLVDFGGGDEVRFERMGAAGVITMTRPNALNALTHHMVKAISRALHHWHHDKAVAAVVIKGEGRAFSAGGDLMAIYNGRDDPPVDFFADEYRLNAQIEAYPKPYVALIDGIVMGGGVGVSFHGSHRVVTENAQFAMPEVGIGFFPDVGASHLLPDLADNYGMYLGLTGARVKWGDALFSGLATHAVKAENLGALAGEHCHDRRAGGIPAQLFFHGPARDRARKAGGDRPLVRAADIAGCGSSAGARRWRR